ncbi:MAG TPA: recombination protein RecR [Cytophagales bacterium]|nr:recombination protein RecR [Cytophagales bacterium]
MDYPSKLIENAVNEVAKLPGIGKKTALRLVLHLVKEPEMKTQALTEALNTLRRQIRFCTTCHNISDEEICSICASARRDRSIICVVEECNDVLAIENTGQFQGVYHVVGGVISPMNGIGPSDLKIESLVQRVSKPSAEVREVILALSPTLEGDTTAFYIHKKLREYPMKVTSIARGVPVGGELEYTDEITLGRSISGRTLFG